MEYIHNKSEFVNDRAFKLTYGEKICSVEIFKIEEGEVFVKYSVLHLSETDTAIVNIPVFITHTKKAKVGGDTIIFKDLNYSNQMLSADSEIETDRAYISVSKAYTAAYPIYAFDSYKREQSPNFENAFMILSCRLDYKNPEIILHVKVKER